MTGVLQGNHNWQDVHSEINNACADLQLGELVHDNMFGLFEAMSAIEIMDPKMDAGMICNRKRRIYQFKEAVEEGIVKVKDFSPDEVLGVIQEISACFVTWLDGQSLVQSVFICLFCHDPYAVEDVIIKSFCIAILKMVDIIRTICNKANVFEEEDFQPMPYGFKLASDVTELRVSGMLRESEEEVARLIKLDRNRRTDLNAEELESREKLYQAIKCTLKFWRSFYCGLLSLEKAECSEVVKALENINAAIAILPELQGTTGLGVQSNYPQSQYIVGFDPLVNQRLLPPSFPRLSEIIERSKAFEYLQALLERLSHICLVTKCATLHHILEFVFEFSRKIPCVLSRSILQLFLYHNNKILGKYALQDMVKESIKLFNSSPAVADLTLLVTTEAKTITNEFLEKASCAMLSLIQAYGHNRARQRERLAVLLEDMGHLQVEADNADQELDIMIKAIDQKKQHLACFESWVLYHSLSIMIQHIFLGFELDLFNPHEFHYVYWYLDYLLGWANNCLARAMMLLQDHKNYTDKKCSKKERKKKKEIFLSVQDMLREHKSLRILFSGMKEMCSANIQAYEAFNKVNKVKHPEKFFDNEKIRFQRRFQSFRFIDTHQSADYADYRQITSLQEHTPASTLFSSSMAHYHRAMDTLQLIGSLDDDVLKLVKVAKTNYIVMKLAASGHKQDSGHCPEWEFSAHKSFPIIKLV